MRVPPVARRVGAPLEDAPRDVQRARHDPVPAALVARAEVDDQRLARRRRGPRRLGLDRARCARALPRATARRRVSRHPPPLHDSAAACGRVHPGGTPPRLYNQPTPTPEASRGDHDSSTTRSRPARLPGARRAPRRRGTRDPRHRAAVRARARVARGRRLVRARDPAARDRAGAREARAVRDAPLRLRASRRERDGVRPHVPRARGGRLGRPQRRVGAGLARDVRDLALGLGGAEGALAAGDAPRRGDRLLRPDGAGRRLRPGHDAHPRAPRRRRLDPQRREDVDHERHDRRRRGRVGADGRRRDQGLPRRAGHAGVLGPGDPQEDLAPRVGHVGARAPGRPRPRPTRCSRAPRRCAARSRA